MVKEELIDVNKSSTNTAYKSLHSLFGYFVSLRDFGTLVHSCGLTVFSNQSQTDECMRTVCLESTTVVKQQMNAIQKMEDNS